MLEESTHKRAQEESYGGLGTEMSKCGGYPIYYFCQFSPPGVHHRLLVVLSLALHVSMFDSLNDTCHGLPIYYYSPKGSIFEWLLMETWGDVLVRSLFLVGRAQGSLCLGPMVW